jgi:CubicO group peptidase (beta-lactamase class C family)
MRALERVLDDAVASGRTPGAVALVADRSGVIHASAHGVRSVGAPEAMSLDTVFRLFSMTKAVASVAALRLIEEGLLTLDTPVGDVLPAFDALQVLEGFDGDVPILRAPASRATIRQLMTHTAGPVYEMWDANQKKYLKAMGLPRMASGARDAFAAYPLAFDPGTRFGYGVSTDWLGLVVEELSGERIDAVLRREIFAPLGMDATGVESSPDMGARMAGGHAHGPDGFALIDIAPPDQPEVYCMGQALYGSGEDYLRFLQMLLGGGALDGARVLSEEGAAMMLSSQTPGIEIGPFASVMPGASASAEFFPGLRKSHSLGLMRVDEDVPGLRRAGSCGWAGLMNTHFWVDPASGICAVLMLQHLPFMDPAARETYEAFERAVYAGSG